MNRTAQWILGIVVVLIIVGLGYALIHNTTYAPGGIAADTASTTQDVDGNPSINATNSISDGTVKLVYPTADFGLATNSQQILTKSYIPPCDSGFTYCIYYTGNAYQGTNFESAGVSVQKRPSLTSQSACLTTPPDGFAASVKPTSTKSGSDYASSVFNNVGDAAAGHLAQGTLYRLYIPATSNCYEFMVRVGQTQFANYPAGSIKQFTQAEQNDIAGELKGILETMSLPSGSTNLFS